MFIYNIFIEYAQQGARTPIISVYACTVHTLIGPVGLLYTCWHCCRLCSVQCHQHIKQVAPSCTKLRTTWGKLQHNFRNILSCVDQSQRGIVWHHTASTNHRARNCLGQTTTTDRPQTNRQVDFMTRPCLVKKKDLQSQVSMSEYNYLHQMAEQYNPIEPRRPITGLEIILHR